MSFHGLTAKQEAFALHVAQGKGLTEAYREAGFSAQGHAVYVNASKLAKKTDIRLRIGEITRQRDNALIATMTVTAMTVTEMLATVFQNATKDRQHGAAATAAMGLAKLHGLLVDKTEDVTRRATRDPDAPVEIDVEHWVTETLPRILGPQQNVDAQGSGAASASTFEPREEPLDVPLDVPAPPGAEPSHQSPGESPDDMGLGTPTIEEPWRKDASEGSPQEGSEGSKGQAGKTNDINGLTDDVGAPGALVEGSAPAPGRPRNGGGGSRTGTIKNLQKTPYRKR